MILTKQEQAILNGEKGETYAKVLKTLVMYGDTFGAEKLVKITHPIHVVTSFGLYLLKPLYSIMDELIESKIKIDKGFTVNPKPLDYENIKYSLMEKIISKIMFSKQKKYENQLKYIGLRDDKAFTCTCYLEEVGNTPKKGDILSWAESSAVVYANSVLGARCNRNSSIIEIFGGIIGKVPYFGLLTDEGRKADWIIEVKTTKIPEAQAIGSAIGMNVLEDVPYIKGLDKFLGQDLTDDVIGYLKDMGAATASNGAVGLYHIDKLTPEAKELKEKLINDNVKTYIIDDAEIRRIIDSYPIMWKNKDATAKKCFIGCPHLTFLQLRNWTKRIKDSLDNNGLNKVNIETIISTSPNVYDKFKKTKEYDTLIKTGTRLTFICPLLYMSNPIAAKKAVITNSNKLRTYTNARYYTDENILNILCEKG